MLRKLAPVALALFVASSAWAQTNKLNVFIRSEYIDPGIVKQFEAAFDCTVMMVLFEDNETMMAKLRGGEDPLCDIAVSPDYVVRELIRLNILAPLRHENIPNLANVDTRFASPPFDPGNQYTAPYQWGTVGIYMRKDDDKPIDKTWGLVFDGSKQPGPFILIDSLREQIGAALKYTGASINATDANAIIAARAALLEARGRSHGFESSAVGKDKVLAKAATLAVVYNRDAARGMEQDPQTVYFVPREGGEIWLDNMAIPAKAPNRDMAETFINYILDAKVGAQLSNFNKYATPNKAAREFVTKEDLENTAIYPPADIMARLEFIKDLGEVSKLYDQIWTQVKSN
ncbi:MAG: spermidine/putrescine ABC transporter substrate-binding protein [bacterium]